MQHYIEPHICDNFLFLNFLNHVSLKNYISSEYFCLQETAGCLPSQVSHCSTAALQQSPVCCSRNSSGVNAPCRAVHQPSSHQPEYTFFIIPSDRAQACTVLYCTVLYWPRLVSIIIIPAKHWIQKSWG